MFNDFTDNRIPGTTTCPKAEIFTTSMSYTASRLYLIPIQSRGDVKFSQYDWDFIVNSIAGGGINYKCAVYEQLRNLSSTGIVASLVAGTSVTVTGQTTAFATTALGATKNLPQGDYWIGFIFEYSGMATFGANNATTNNTSIRGGWVYNDPGSFTLPSTITGSNLAYIHASENPFYAALTYIGDVIP